MKVCVIQSNHDECRCECKEFNDWSSCRNDYIWNPTTCDCECNKACKIDEHLDTKNCSSEKRLIGKSVLECEDKILNTTETSINDKKVTYGKSNCLIQTILLVLIFLLLLAIVYIASYY